MNTKFYNRVIEAIRSGETKEDLKITVDNVEYEWCDMMVLEPACYDCALFIKDVCKAPKCLSGDNYRGFWKRIKK